MGRICIAGDQDPELISQVIGRWQNWEGGFKNGLAVISMCAVIPFRFYNGLSNYTDKSFLIFINYFFRKKPRLFFRLLSGV